MLNDKNIPSDVIEKSMMIKHVPKKRNKRSEVRAHCEHFNIAINEDKFDNANESRKKAKNALMKLILANGWDTEEEEFQDAARALSDSYSQLILSRRIRPKNDEFTVAMKLQSDIELIDEYIKLTIDIKNKDGD